MANEHSVASRMAATLVATSNMKDSVENVKDAKDAKDAKDEIWFVRPLKVQDCHDYIREFITSVVKDRIGHNKRHLNTFIGLLIDEMTPGLMKVFEKIHGSITELCKLDPANLHDDGTFDEDKVFFEKGECPDINNGKKITWGEIVYHVFEVDMPMIGYSLSQLADHWGDFPYDDRFPQMIRVVLKGNPVFEKLEKKREEERQAHRRAGKLVTRRSL